MVIHIEWYWLLPDGSVLVYENVEAWNWLLG